MLLPIGFVATVCSHFIDIQKLLCECVHNDTLLIIVSDFRILTLVDSSLYEFHIFG